jgi:ABC-2 type transport system ATP-binding protein
MRMDDRTGRGQTVAVSRAPGGTGRGPADDAPAMIEIRGLNKTYDNGFQALKTLDLSIRKGEIFALLGPNGAGKTTLISIVCGIVNKTAGTVRVGGYDIIDDYRAARRQIGLVPQELATDAFETVWNTVSFSRGLFGEGRHPDLIAKILNDLSLADKKDSVIMALSGGMKRRVMIAKALSHEPAILFLDEPTAGVDVELRRGMWDVVLGLREKGVTIILTTHYIAEAEELADRVGVINNGQIVLVEEKDRLMKRFAQKRLTLTLSAPIERVPAALDGYGLELSPDGLGLTYAFDVTGERTGITKLLNAVRDAGLAFHDLDTRQNSLEDIFVDLVGQQES